MAKMLVKIACYKDLDRFGGAPKASFHQKKGIIKCVTGKDYLEIIQLIVKVSSCVDIGTKSLDHISHQWLRGPKNNDEGLDMLFHYFMSII